MEKFKSSLILVLVLIILLLHTCGKRFYCSDSNVVYKDSITTKIDTLWTKDTIYSFKSYKPKVKDSVKTTEYTIIDHGPCQYKRFYQDSLVDSNIVIYNSDTTLGLLLGKQTSYKLKVPQKIIITNTIIKTPEFKEKIKLFIGGQVGGNRQQFEFSPNVTLETKQSNLYSVEYGLINKTISVGFGYNILNRKNKKKK